MKKAILLFALLIVSFLENTAHAQKKGQELIDSLQTALKESKQDTNRVNILNQLSQHAGWRAGNMEAATNYAEQALQLARKIHFKKGEAVAYRNIGVVYKNQGNYPEALENSLASLKIAEEIGDKNGIAFVYNNIGMVYTNQGNYPEALENYTASLKIAEEIGDKHRIASSYNNIGSVYLYQGNYPKALENYLAALKIAEEIGDKQGIANAYNNIGIVYLYQGNYPEAVENYFASLKIREEIGDKQGIAASYNNIGNVYSTQGNYPEALEYNLKSLKIYEEVGNKHGIASSYLNIGSVYTMLNQPREGKIWLQKGLVLSRELGTKEVIKDIYAVLVTADSALHNWKGAYENYKQYTVYKDSLYNEENTKKLMQVAMQYEFDKKEALAKVEQEKKDILAREQLAEAKNNRNLALAGVGVFMVAAVFSGIGFYQKRKSNQIITREKQKSDELLLNILPEEVAQELKTTGTSEAKHFDSVSIMFTDFKEFTQQAGKMSSKDLIGELNYCFKHFDEIITKHGIEKIKTIGDAYMAVCGLPVPQEKHAQKMIEAALEIRDFIEAYKQQRQNEGKHFFEMRIGINSGEVVAGIVGIKKFAYDIWGDAVNVAARMESNGEVGKVNISETTYQLAKDNFDFEHRGEIQAKGKGKINMYFVETKQTEAV